MIYQEVNKHCSTSDANLVMRGAASRGSPVQFAKPLSLGPPLPLRLPHSPSRSGRSFPQLTVGQRMLPRRQNFQGLTFKEIFGWLYFARKKQPSSAVFEKMDIFEFLSKLILSISTGLQRNSMNSLCNIW